MANNFDSNITRKLAKVFLDKFDSQRVMSKNVNTQLLSGQFNPSSGDTVDFKRPTDYLSTTTAAGDISGATASSIITGKASGTVQNYRTVFVDFNEADEAIKMDQIDELLAPMANRMVTDLELDYASYMMKNSGLVAGTPGQGVATWDEVAEAGAVLQSTGVPMDEKWCYAVNPYTQRSLASNQRSLGAGGAAGSLVKNAVDKATIAENFAGMNVMTATTLPSFTTGAGADKVGAVASVDVTYVTAKDTMTQSIGVSGFTSGLVVKAGERVTVAATNMLNLSTRQPILDETGANVLWSGVVTADVTLTGGSGTLVVSGPGIYEAAGAYNTTSRAIAAADVITITTAASTTFQPNLFWHKQAFGLGFVPIKKLYSTDTLATTKDGIQMRVSKYSGGDTNAQTVRFDIRPAYATLNPFFAGHGYGVA